MKECFWSIEQNQIRSELYIMQVCINIDKAITKITGWAVSEPCLSITLNDVSLLLIWLYFIFDTTIHDSYNFCMKSWTILVIPGAL